MENSKLLMAVSHSKNEYKRKVFMTPKEFSKEYGIGITKTYELANTKGFPIIRNGNRILIIRSKVEDWIESNIGLEF